ncbi:hypothetical protein G3496_00915 [Shewanella baltica]|uniref:hypothetical protein n=1 Tax=Shewanella baltica TaxID=62322 RepID=UPI00217E565C|nr:hypothetical protein [Shewanella baltica]MCS6133516.1 hypothetical protein [Shewanella baltica]
MAKFLNLFSLSLIFTSTFCYANEPTKVFLDGDKIHYQGGLAKEANEMVFEIFKKNTSKIKWLAIKSVGGEVNLGLDLAEFINKNSLKVEVTEYCLSSCANYVFPAAHEKLITNHALIGFHGGTSGMAAGVAEFIKTLPESEREATQKHFDEYGEKTLAREADFFQRLGVNPNITTLGQSDKYKKYEDAGSYVGWYYAISDLNKLGVKNISVLNPPWVFKQLSEKSQFYKVEVTGS